MCISPKQEKQKLRNLIRSRFRKLKSKKSIDLTVVEKLSQIINLNKYSSILFYQPLADEVDISDIFIHPQAKMDIYFPFFQKHAIYHKDSRAEFSFDNLPKISCVVLPGRVFDKNGNRIGRGFGWYDRLIKHLEPETEIIGVCFGFQIFDRVPVEKHDEKVHIVCTDQGIYK